MKQTAQKSVLLFSLGTRAKIVLTKKEKKNKNHARVIFHPFAGTPPLGRSVWILACWTAGSYRRRNYPCQILWQSVQVFRSSDTPNFALLHRNSWSPLQQCKYYRATQWLLRTTLSTPIAGYEPLRLAARPHERRSPVNLSQVSSALGNIILTSFP